MVSVTYPVHQTRYYRVIQKDVELNNPKGMNIKYLAKNESGGMDN